MRVEEVTCGEIHVASVQLAEGRFRPRLFRDGVPVRAPEEDDTGHAPIGFSLVVVAASQKTIVVDPGLDDPGSEGAARFRATFAVADSISIDAALAAVGVTPADVDHVLLTHAHLDHLSGATREHLGQLVPRFARARYLLGAADRHGARYDGKPEPEVERRLALLEAHDRLAAAGNSPVVPGIDLMAAPGESPGHHVVRIRSGGTTCLLLGDLFHLPSEVEHHDWVPLGRDAETLRASRKALLPIATEPRTVCHLHHATTRAFGVILRDANGFRWGRA